VEEPSRPLPLGEGWGEGPAGEGSPAQGSSLAESERDGQCLDAALRFLANRPRSEREIRRRLTEKGYEPGRIDNVLGRLADWKLVDDRAFAEYWLENRLLHRPKGARALRAELFQKGVGRDVIDQALTGERDEADDAYRAVQKLAQRFRVADQREFRQRLGQYLLRRGFDWEAIESATTRLWAERGGDPGDVEPEG
jgi:regulatory protein